MGRKTEKRERSIITSRRELAIISCHSDWTFTFDVQKKVGMSGTDDRNLYVFFAGVGVDNSLTKIATADGGGFGGCAGRHRAVDLAHGVLRSRVPSGEVEQRHVDGLAA